MESSFATIAQRAIADAEAINCSFEDFIDGLRTMIDTIDNRFWLAVHDEHNIIEGEVVDFDA